MLMAIDLREARVAPAGEPIAPAARRTAAGAVTTWILVSVLAGLAAGAVTHSLATAGSRAASRVAQVQADRAQAAVEAYERAWMAAQPSGSRIRVTGTGPGLAWVAAQQEAWAEHAVTGTGPGLVTVARMQMGDEPGTEPSGTGPGLERLPGRIGSEVAVIGTP